MRKSKEVVAAPCSLANCSKAASSRKDRGALGGRRARAAQLQTGLWAASLEATELLGQAVGLRSGRTGLPKSESSGLTGNYSVQCQVLEIAATAADQRQCWLDARILCHLVIFFCQGPYIIKGKDGCFLIFASFCFV